VVNGQRYAIRAEPNRVESQRDYGIVGAIVGAVNGGQVRGRAVRIPRDSIVTFRLERPLEMGVADRGVTRNGYHYHDWYNRDREHQKTDRNVQPGGRPSRLTAAFRVSVTPYRPR